MIAEGKFRQSYNDSTGGKESAIMEMVIGDNPARKMEAKSIMISMWLPVDLLVCIPFNDNGLRTEKRRKKGKLSLPQACD
ncbi:hypothetical protein FV767_11130 [Vibrio parahaemolyticus]|nr:hypothetical protein [Vibrio parahaemolyticus]MDL2043278.1 hypothetical protein [Vibrio parahaemolyticus]